MRDEDLNNKRAARLVSELAAECLNRARVSPKAAQVLQEIAETYLCKAKRLYPTMKLPLYPLATRQLTSKQF